MSAQMTPPSAQDGRFLPDLAHVRAVLFDFDGTLVDTERLILESMMRVLDEEAPGRFRPEDIRRNLGLTLDAQLRLYFPGRTDEEYARLAARYREDHERRFAEGVRVFPGVPELLRALKEAGIPAAVVTNRHRRTLEFGVHKLGLAPCFATLVAYQDVERHKPDPEPILAAHARLEVPPTHALMVGDQPEDRLAAKGAGVHFAWAGWNPLARTNADGDHAPVFPTPRDLLITLFPLREGGSSAFC
ncbi:MAG: HAD-IA family hydrolase [Brockia lithotrophica]|nr:HAD-IA family hydrolase [Brockia lithotrophica]